MKKPKKPPPSRWIVIYATFPSEAGPSTVKAALIEHAAGETPDFIKPSAVAADCFAVHAIVEIIGDELPTVVIAGNRVPLDG